MEVRTYEPSDHDACLELLRRGHDPDFSAERFDWLHEECPHGRSMRLVCSDRGRVVGFYAAIPKRFILGNTTLVGAHDVDPVVDPAYRGRGVFGSLLDFALGSFRGVDFFFNFANDASRPGFLSRGWKVLGLLHDAICQLGCRRWKPLDAVLYLATAARARSLPKGTILRGDLKTILAEHGLPIVPPADRLWVDRSEEYLLWRYARSPLRRYRCYALEIEGRVRLALLVRRESPGGPLLLVDVMGSDPFEYDLGPLIGALRRDHPGARAMMWDTTAPTARRFFLVNPMHRSAGYPLLIRGGTGSARIEERIRFERLFLTYGDMEHF